MQGRVQQSGDGIRAVQVRFGQNLFSAIEGWRRQQAVIPTRPEAIRTLVQKSLAEPAESEVRS